jgi:hypothetical protein
MGVTIDELVVADRPEAWRAAGFTVDGDTCRIGTVRVRLAGPEGGTGVVAWSLRGVPDDRAADLAAHGLDGVPTTVSHEPPGPAGTHPLGVTHLDHVVLTSPDLARTTAALESLGIAARRTRDTELGGAPLRQVFFRLGEVILELIGAPDATGEGPATFWGLTHAVTDIDAAAALLGEHVGRVKDAVQPGRRITTLRHRALGLSVATALISPQPDRQQPDRQQPDRQQPDRQQPDRQQADLRPS